MKRFFKTFILFLLISVIFACGSGAVVNDEEAGDDFKMLAIVIEVGERIEVEVIESDYAFGIYWVITHDKTVYLDKDGNEISRADIKAGDKIEISYNGQTMMSYPPQIVGIKIKITE